MKMKDAMNTRDAGINRVLVMRLQNADVYAIERVENEILVYLVGGSELAELGNVAVRDTGVMAAGQNDAVLNRAQSAWAAGLNARNEKLRASGFWSGRS